MKTLTKVLMLGVIVLVMVNCKKDENKPIACFEITSESIDNGDDARVGEKITFENCSQNAVTFAWDFGDGENSTSRSPKHEYEETGTYSVTLDATNSDGTSTLTQDVDVLPSLSGDWEGTFYLETSVFPFYFDIEQTGNELEGSFVFTDGSGYAEFSSGSEVDDDEVTIKFTIYDPQLTMNFKFEGDINDDYDEMSGNYTITASGGSLTGTWSASKTSSKSTRSSGEYLKTGKDILENIIKELK